MRASQVVPPAPAVLRLVQLAVLGRWRATGEELYREVVRLTEVGAGQEMLVSGCGEGVTAEWLATRSGAAVTGVDPDPERIERAEARARALPEPLPLSYEQAALDDLPHETAVFDCAVGELVLAAAASPERAVEELVRVTKPMGAVVLLQLTWCAELGGHGRELLVERLGLRPRLLVEWKQMLRDAGVVDIQVQDWTSGGPGSPARGSGATKGAGGEPPLTWQQKMQIVGRAWRQWGWREARGAVERETTLLRELSRERAIGFQLIKGVKWPHAREP
ncbi:MAG: class I SAM-dependent methyltransferase [Gemmatimonadaceae bacterium]